MYLRAYAQSASRMLKGLEGWGGGSFHFVLILKLKIFLLFKNVCGGGAGEMARWLFLQKMVSVPNAHVLAQSCP